MSGDLLQSRTFQPGKMVLGYTLVKRIGKGGFGSIWVIKDPVTQKLFALKAEKRKHHVNTLLIEKTCLSLLQDSPYFPIIYQETTIPRYNVLIMECLGPSLRKLRHKMHGDRFSLSTGLRVGIEMLRAIRAFHEHGFIHRDIKPDNFCLRPSRSAPLALIDYGLARRYLSPDGKKLPVRCYVGFTGTSKFANIATHEHQEQLRRDDCQSWYYAFLQLILGRLPWSGVEGRDAVYAVKQETNFESLLSLRPHQLVEVHDILFSLPHEEEPPYEEVIGLLEEAFEQLHFSWDDPYDWDLIKPKKMMHLSAINLTPPKDDRPIVPLKTPRLGPRSMSVGFFNLSSEPSVGLGSAGASQARFALGEETDSPTFVGHAGSPPPPVPPKRRGSTPKGLPQIPKRKEEEQRIGLGELS